jgi:hypothetical protein
MVVNVFMVWFNRLSLLGSFPLLDQDRREDGLSRGGRGRAGLAVYQDVMFYERFSRLAWYSRPER